MRTLFCVVALCVFAVALIAADTPFAGTWKLNTAKSHGTPGTLSKEETVVFEAVGSEIKRTVTGIDPDGERLNMSATIAWDGKEHKVEGPKGPPVMVAVKSVNDRRINVTVKRADGKVLQAGHADVSKDGKTMTSTFKAEDPKGRKFNNVEVFDRQ
jgi:hypothetical protein